MTLSHPNPWGERTSARIAVTAEQYDKSGGRAMALALDKVTRMVDRRVGARERAATYYYITYEVVFDDDGSGPGRPVWSQADREAAHVVFARMPERERAEAAA